MSSERGSLGGSIGTSRLSQEYRASFDEASAPRALSSYQPRIATVPQAAPVQSTASMVLTRDSIPSLPAVGGRPPEPFLSTNPMHSHGKPPRQVPSLWLSSTHANAAQLPPLTPVPSRLSVAQTHTQQPPARPPAVGMAPQVLHLAQHPGQLGHDQPAPSVRVYSQHLSTPTPPHGPQNR